MASDGAYPTPPGAEGLAAAVRAHLRWLDAMGLVSLAGHALRNALQVYERANPPEIVRLAETLKRQFRPGGPRR